MRGTYIVANRGPSDHKAIGSLAMAVRRGRSKPTAAAIGKVR